VSHFDLAKSSIEQFSVAVKDYQTLATSAAVSLTGNAQHNQVLVKDNNYDARIQINFNQTAGCQVFIGHKVRGDMEINLNGDNSVIYLGNHCDLKQLQIRSRQANDLIAIGEEVSVAGNNVWVSGYGAGDRTPAIIVGDDCMFSYDIVIRNTDAHPIFDADTDLQINQPQSALHIEPHVWVGERSNILKDVTVGACSIIALGSTVTKDAPRFSAIKGVPASALVQADRYWARDHSDFAMRQAKYYRDKYTQM
jgi:acetyltransferase-like isoleucine patch superfamily enzyme